MAVKKPCGVHIHVHVRTRSYVRSTGHTRTRGGYTSAALRKTIYGMKRDLWPEIATEVPALFEHSSTSKLSLECSLPPSKRVR